MAIALRWCWRRDVTIASPLTIKGKAAATADADGSFELIYRDCSVPETKTPLSTIHVRRNAS